MFCVIDQTHFSSNVFVLVIKKYYHSIVSVIGNRDVVLSLSKKNVTVSLESVNQSETIDNIRSTLHRITTEFKDHRKLDLLLLCNKDNTRRFLEQVRDTVLTLMLLVANLSNTK